MKIRFFSWLFLLMILISVGCSDYQRILKGSDYVKKMEKAVELYNRKKYAKAIPLFEELITISRGTLQAREVYYYYAYCHYGVGDFILANFWFENYAQAFPNSDKTEEVEFMAAYCHYMDSPRIPLDQTNTDLAKIKLQNFIDKYPNSTRKEECNGLIEELRDKQEAKAYRAAMLYYFQEYYLSAVVSLQNILRDFPDTERRAEIMFYIIKSGYLYAANSVPSKKEERFNEVKQNYSKFVVVLGASPFSDEANAIHQKTINELAEIKAVRDKLAAQQQKKKSSGNNPKKEKSGKKVKADDKKKVRQNIKKS